jgi:hypothetical protein
MSKDANKSSLGDERLVLQEAYANLYNEITKPKQVFVDSQYFRKKWVPLLGHSLGWLVVALRQHCYWNRQTGELRDWCVVSQEEIAEEVGIDSRTLRRLLKREYADKFVLEVDKRYRYDSKLGKQVRVKTFYRIRMDDPLTPEDEQLLRKRLTKEMAGYNINPETGQLDMLKLLDRPLNETPYQPDKMSARSTQAENIPDSSLGDQPDKESARLDQPDKMSDSPPHQPDKMSAGSDNQPDKMSPILYTGQNVRNHDNTYIIHTSSGKVQQQQFTHADVVVQYEELRDLTLTGDQVLIPNNHNNAYCVKSLTEIVKSDIGAMGHYDPWRLSTCRREVFYSVEHAFGEGGDEWTAEEIQKIHQREKLEQELGERFNRLGAFSVTEALKQYFSPKLVERFTQGQVEDELNRIEAWLVYTHQNNNLRNPAGFLRSKIESGEPAP